MKKFPYLKTGPFGNSIFRRENIFRLFFGKSGFIFKLLKTHIPRVNKIVFWKEMDRQRRILISVLSGVRPKPLHILFYVRYQNRYYGNHISKREYFQITFWKIWVYFQAFKNSKEVGNMRKIWNWKFRLRGKKISSDTKIGPWFQSYTSSEIDRPDT